MFKELRQIYWLKFKTMCQNCENRLDGIQLKKKKDLNYLLFFLKDTTEMNFEKFEFSYLISELDTRSVLLISKIILAFVLFYSRYTY